MKKNKAKRYTKKKKEAVKYYLLFVCGFSSFLELQVFFVIFTGYFTK
jgi:hypothetical protein